MRVMRQYDFGGQAFYEFLDAKADNGVHAVQPASFVDAHYQSASAATRVAVTGRAAFEKYSFLITMVRSFASVAHTP